MRWQGLILTTVACAALDVAVGWSISRYFGDRYSDHLTPAFVLAGILWASQLYVALRSGLASLLVSNTEAAKTLAARLTTEGFPRAARHDNVDRYLSRIGQDLTLQDDLRDRANFYRGELAGFAAGGGMMKGIALSAMWDKAIHLVG